MGLPSGAPGGPASNHHSPPSAVGLAVLADGPRGGALSATKPSGLVGLASLLGSSNKERLALVAVVTALSGVGVVLPEDLALIGSGDDLPEEVIEAMAKPRKALKHPW